jgi:hypothetical protein
MQKLPATWQVPKQVVAFSTTRRDGVSRAPFNSFNLGFHVGDKASDVEQNRAILEQSLPNKPIWLSQTHSNNVLIVNQNTSHDTLVEADALYTREANQPLAIMTADCLPVFLCSSQGDEVAVIHAGWRGLLNGVIENTLNNFDSSNLIAHLGPAIGPMAFEVGDDVKQAFCTKFSQVSTCFVNIIGRPDKYFANLYTLAATILNRHGITAISGGQYCTYSQQTDFFSYRKEGKTGRNGHIIYFSNT